MRWLSPQLIAAIQSPKKTGLNCLLADVDFYYIEDFYYSVFCCLSLLNPPDRASGMQFASTNQRGNMKFKDILLGLLVGSTLASGAAHALMVERTTEINLSLLNLPASELTVVAPLTPFTLDVGDKFVFHLNFGGSALKITDLVAAPYEYIGFNFPSNPVGQTGFAYNGKFHFEGVKGDLLLNDVSYGFGGPIGGFIPYGNLTDTEFSFTGITYTVDVWYKEPRRPAFTSNQVEFRVMNIGATSAVITSIPEPDSIALIGLALSGLAASRRMRVAIS